MDINELKDKFSIKYYNNIIKYCKRTNISSKPFEEILDKFKESQNSIKDSSISETQNFDLNFSNDYLYKKPWTKLSNIHRKIKIKEFVSKLLIDSNKEKKDLESKLIELIDEKFLTKKDRVKYDSINGRIIAIPILTYLNGKYYIKNINNEINLG